MRLIYVGIVRPGGSNSIGTLNIVTYIQQLNGRLDIDIDSGSSDLLTVTGNATYSGVISLNFLSVPVIGSFYTFCRTGLFVRGGFNYTHVPSATVQLSYFARNVSFRY